MEYTFYIESKFRARRDVNYLKFCVPDGTEFALSEEWMVSTQRRKRTPIQRLIFLKRNNYDYIYRITVELSSVTNEASGKIVLSRKTKSLRTSVIILLSDFQQLHYPIQNKVIYEDVEICERAIHDTFKYKITLIRLNVSEKETGAIPEKDKILIMSNQFQSLLETKDFCDVIITGKCEIHGDNCVVKAHRNILAARSAYFSCMFENKWKEAKNIIININETDMILVKEMVYFIYTGVIRPVKFSIIFDLYMEANKFLLYDLKKLLSKELEKHLNAENSVGIFMSAHYTLDTSLKNISLQFISDNFDRVQNTETWHSLQMARDSHTIVDYQAIMETIDRSVMQAYIDL